MTYGIRGVEPEQDEHARGLLRLERVDIFSGGVKSGGSGKGSRICGWGVCFVGVVFAGEGQSLTVWVVDPLVKVLRTDLPESGRKTCEISSARGEYESGQIAFRSTKKVEKLTARATPLKDRRGRELGKAVIRFVGFVHLEKNTVPHLAETGQQVLVAAVWLTLFVPREAKPGTYTGRVYLKAGDEERRVRVVAKVYSATVPKETSLKVANWYYPVVLTHAYRVKWWDEKHWKLIEQDAKSMAEHRQSVGYIILNETIRAVERKDGSISFDFTNFGRIAETYLKAGMNWLMGSAIAGRNIWFAKDFYAIPLRLLKVDDSIASLPGPEKPNGKVYVMSEAFEKYVSLFLPALQKHLEEKGRVGKYIQLQADEPVEANARAYRRLAEVVVKYAPELGGAEAVRTTNIVGTLDVWVPLLSDLDKQMKFYKAGQKAGDEVWFYTVSSTRQVYESPH